jgi:hypothetical protein
MKYQELCQFRPDVATVTDQEVASRRIANEASAGNVFCGVASTLVGPKQVFFGADHECRKDDLVQVITWNRRGNRGSVPFSVAKISFDPAFPDHATIQVPALAAGETFTHVDPLRKWSPAASGPTVICSIPEPNTRGASRKH